MRPAEVLGLSAQQRSELWRRREMGQTLVEIASALGKSWSSLSNEVVAQGGIAPRERRRAKDALGLADREEISRGISCGDSLRLIAARIGKAPSTISREVNRNGGLWSYRAAAADARAWSNARRPKRCKLAVQRTLRCVVAAKLQLDWSPEQIAGWLRREFPDDDAMHVSHETIYRSLFVQARGVLKKELMKHLRSQRPVRRAKNSTQKGHGRGQLVDMISIRERPPEIEDRSVPGHWEGDLLTGANRTHIATLVERQTRFTKLVKVAGKDSVSVLNALTAQIKTLPKDLVQTLTWDRGKEMAGHKAFSVAADVKVFFCDPQSPWQRGSNENTNGLLRQYLPSRSDFSQFSQAELNRIARRLNTRPRKTLGFQTPAEKLQALLL
jgi:IS30 family transposase